MSHAQLRPAEVPAVAVAPANSSGSPPPCAPPPRHRMAVLVWIAIHPTITLLLALGGSSIDSWPLPLRTLALTVVAVPLMVFVLLPRLQRVLNPWLARWPTSWRSC
jgi:antibiotic biosynthesis monooxygenase (ABM) superfamily enzyme